MITSPATSAPARLWPRAFGSMVPILIGLYAVLDSWVFYVGNEQRIAYTAITGLCLVLALLGLPRTQAPRRAWALILAWVGLCLLPLIPVATQDVVLPSYVVGDLASMALPLVMFLVLWALPGMLHPTRALLPYALLLGLAAIAAALSPASYNDRHADPVLLAFVFGWAFFHFGPANQRWRWVSLYLLILLVVAFSSGYRSSLAQWFLIGLMVQFLAQGARTAIISGVALAIGGSLYLLLTPPDVLEEQLAATRLDTLVGEEGDSSLESRSLEAKDIWATVEGDWTPMNWLFGQGHGATFRPVHSDPWRNINDQGTVHNVHITPVLLFFRYGLLGLLGFAALVWAAISQFFRTRQEVRQGTASMTKIVFAVGMVVYLLDSMRHVVLVDPAFSYTLAGFLRLRFPWNEPV